MKTIHDLLLRHGLFSAFFFIWAMAIVTFATWSVFSSVTEVTGAVATAYSALLAIPPAAIAFIKWRADK